MNVAFSWLWLFGIFSIVYFWKPQQPEVAAVCSIAITALFGVFLYLIVVHLFGVFADVIPPTIVEILGLELTRRIELMLE